MLKYGKHPSNLRPLRLGEEIKKKERKKEKKKKIKKQRKKQDENIMVCPIP